MEFDKGLEHKVVQIDKMFYESTYLPLYARLAEIAMHKVYFVSKTTQKIYGGTAYLNSKIMASILESSGASVTRFKGLGEMNPVWLWESTMNPKTRNLVRLTVQDAVESERNIKMFLGNNSEEKKEFLLNMDGALI
jgi:DNA gyrase/topoisomerase IV subunit B